MIRTLTLELDDEIAARAEGIAKATGRSVSQIVSDLLQGLPEKTELEAPPKPSLPEPHCAVGAPRRPRSPTPLVDSLAGILRGADVDEEDYYKHLEDKYL